MSDPFDFHRPKKAVGLDHQNHHQDHKGCHLLDPTTEVDIKVSTP